MIMEKSNQKKTEEQDNAGVVAQPPVVYAIPLILGLVLHSFVSVTFLPETLKLILGLPLLGVGVFLMAKSFRTFRLSGTSQMVHKPTQVIVVNGPYRFSRNPMYIALTLIYTGISFSFNSLWPMLLLPIVLLVIHFGVIRREERYLEGKFGDEYLQYKAGVRRWI